MNVLHNSFLWQYRNIYIVDLYTAVTVTYVYIYEAVVVAIWTYIVFALEFADDTLVCALLADLKISHTHTGLMYMYKCCYLNYKWSKSYKVLSGLYIRVADDFRSIGFLVWFIAFIGLVDR